MALMYIINSSVDENYDELRYLIFIHMQMFLFFPITKYKNHLYIHNFISSN